MWSMINVLRKILKIPISSASDTRVHLSNYSRFSFNDYDPIVLCANTYVDTNMAKLDFSIRNKSKGAFDISPYTKGYTNSVINPYVTRNGNSYTMNLPSYSTMISDLEMYVGDFNFYGGNRSVRYTVSVDGVGTLYDGEWFAESTHGGQVRIPLRVKIPAITFRQEASKITIRVVIASGSGYVLHDSAEVISFMNVKVANGVNKPKDLMVLVVEK